jgi:peptidoglycan hydrolase CwlO-like protein
VFDAMYIFVDTDDNELALHQAAVISQINENEAKIDTAINEINENEARINATIDEVNINEGKIDNAINEINANELLLLDTTRCTVFRWFKTFELTCYFVDTDDAELQAHNASVFNGLTEIRSILSDETLFTDDVELGAHFTLIDTLVKAEIDDVQVDVGLVAQAVADVKQQGGEIKQDVADVQTQVAEVKDELVVTHAHIEALIGDPSSIPAINNDVRKRQGNVYDSDF